MNNEIKELKRENIKLRRDHFVGMLVENVYNFVAYLVIIVYVINMQEISLFIMFPMVFAALNFRGVISNLNNLRKLLIEDVEFEAKQ